MGIMKPKISSRQPKTQATPLAGDILQKLRAEVAGENFGEGMSAHQREAGTAIRQFISNRADPSKFNELIDPIIAQSQSQTDRGAAQIRESFGMTGNRLSSSLARAEGQFRNEAAMNRDAMISRMFQENQNQLLGALGAQQGMGIQNMQPAFDFALMGILPEQTMVGDSPFKQFMGAAVPITTAAIAASDERGKENIASADDAVLQIFRKLDPSMFDYKNPEAPGASPGRQIGVMAQDLEKTPTGDRAVKDTGAGKMVDFGQLMPVIVAGLSALVKRLDSLQPTEATNA